MRAPAMTASRSLIVMSARLSVLAIMTAAHTPAAWAHHPMGGATPTTFWQGLLSGVGHPIIGLDHLAYVVALGVVAGLSRRIVALPALFIAAMLVGVAAHLARIDLPGAESWIAASVFLIGLLLAASPGAKSGAALWILGAAGVLHGHALAEAVVGAEPTPIAAYLAGLGVTQFIIGVGVALLVSGAIAAAPRVSPMHARFVGAGVMLVGLVAAARAAALIS